MEKSPLINILCYQLPGDLSKAIYHEYNSRWAEIEYYWKNNDSKYIVLRNYEPTIRLLLAMSTFYRRVLSGFDGARDFYKTVSKNHDIKENSAIRIGQFILDNKQFRKLQAIKISFGDLKEKYGISNSFFEYHETYEFLEKCLQLYYCCITPDEGTQEDLPF